MWRSESLPLQVKPNDSGGPQLADRGNVWNGILRHMRRVAWARGNGRLSFSN
jgi:hypothetical protein